MYDLLLLMIKTFIVILFGEWCSRDNTQGLTDEANALLLSYIPRPCRLLLKNARTFSKCETAKNVALA